MQLTILVLLNCIQGLSPRSDDVLRKDYEIWRLINFTIQFFTTFYHVLAVLPRQYLLSMDVRSIKVLKITLTSDTKKISTKTRPEFIVLVPFEREIFPNLCLIRKKTIRQKGRYCCCFVAAWQFTTYLINDYSCKSSSIISCSILSILVQSAEMSVYIVDGRKNAESGK